MTSFVIDEKRVDVFPCAEPNRPILYLNTYGREGEAVRQHLQEAGCPPFTLVAISQLDWNHDMAPWDIPPLSEKAAPCTGGADDYLALLLGKILPAAETALPGAPAWRGLAGYSLAGLFALYALYRTDRFSRVASISGSLWFPGIREYIAAHQPVRRPDCLYFSLGDREHRTRNRYLRCVEQNTQAIAAFYQARGIDTIFQHNPGNHFQNGALRTAAGLHWLITR